MPFLLKLKTMCLSWYHRLPIGLRRFLHRNRYIIGFALALGMTVYSYVLLFTLPNFVLLISFKAFIWLMYLLLIVFGFLIPFACTKGKGRLRAVCVTMAACAALLFGYNFSTVVNRLGQIPIDSIEDFSMMNRLESGSFVLVDDIDCKGKRVPTVHRFSGTFNGSGYTIKNLSLKDSSLFVANYGEISELRLTNLVLTSTGKTTAFVAQNNGTVANIDVDGMRVLAQKSPDVGLFAVSNSTLSEIHAYGVGFDIESCDRVGVLAGTCAGLENCSASGSISASSDKAITIGGLAGKITDKAKPISLCSAKVGLSINAKNKAMVGGLFGSSASKKPIVKCHSAGSANLNGEKKANIVFGGICATASRLDMSNCMFTGEVTFGGNGAVTAGGLIGDGTGNDAFRIGSCYSAGSMNVVTGNATIGGFVGQLVDVSEKTSGASLQKSFTVMNVSASDGASCSYNAAIGSVKTDSYEFVQDCCVGDTLTGAIDQGLRSVSASDMLTKTFCVTELGWNHTVWSFSGGSPVLQNIDTFVSSNSINAVSESDKIYQCKTISVYPSTLYDTYRERLVVCGDSVNIRKGPGTQYDKITTVENGKKVTAVADQNGWSLIKIKDGYGWIINDYLK